MATVNGIDRTYVGRIVRPMSLGLEIVVGILNGDPPVGISLPKLRTNPPVI